MVRMSDILKNLKDTKRKRRSREEKRAPESKAKRSETRPPLPAQEGPPSKLRVRKAFSQGELKEDIKTFAEKEAPKPFVPRVSRVVMKEITPTPSEDTKKLYEETLNMVKKILESDKVAIEINKITQEIEKIINELKSDSKEGILILALIKNPKDTDRNYLPYHLLNTCIFTIEVGIVLGYGKSKLIELGISALLYDIGMKKCMHIVNQNKKLDKDEYDDIKRHTMRGSDILEDVKDIIKPAIDVARQHHERLDGSGYPKGLEGDSISEYARIIGLVDAFEAMTHWRVYRDEFPPLEAVKELISHQKSFEHKIIKILIENIGLFPVGSLVELSTKEIAQVIKINQKTPFRPIIRIIINANREKLEATRQVNLLAETNISISRGLIKKESEQKPS